MTVKELKERMQMIEDQGCGDSEVLTWDPDTDDWQIVTVMTYGKGPPVQLYTDEP